VGGVAARNVGLGGDGAEVVEFVKLSPLVLIGTGKCCLYEVIHQG
jgi:hypothetical protein